MHSALVLGIAVLRTRFLSLFITHAIESWVFLKAIFHIDIAQGLARSLLLAKARELGASLGLKPHNAVRAGGQGKSQVFEALSAGSFQH